MTERKYYSNLLYEHKSDLKKSWNILKKVLNKHGTKSVNCKFKYRDKIIDDKELIAEKFNDFFINIGPTLANNIPKNKNTPLMYLKNKITDSLFLAPVTENEVIKIIANLKNSAAGWDDFRADVVKQIKECIIIPLTHVCNASVMSGVFPNELKLANVVPIFKSGDNAIFSNYRPVSVLPVFSKIIERIMYNRLLAFLNKHDVLYDFQFGFREKYSTYMALITLVEKISTALDKGQKVIGVFLDFSKAFDTVNHSILLKKLEHYGVRGVALKWFENYLSSRKQYVSFNSAKSTAATITCGVPQGSILGPLLFLIYINDMSHVAKNSFMLLFADDSNLFFTGKDMNDLVCKVNAELQSIMTWLQVNRLSLNIKKTHYIVFCGKKNFDGNLDIKINNTMIDRVFSTKFLGVQIDQHLNWKCHIDYIAKKLSKCVGILSRARCYLPKECLINLYYTFAYPYFTYCIHVWGNTYSTYLDKLIKMQKKNSTHCDLLQIPRTYCPFI